MPSTDQAPTSPRRRTTTTRVLASGACVFAIIAVCALAAPDPAHAVGINPLDALDDLLGAGANAISGGIGGAAVDGFGAILRALFAVPAKLINRELLAWLVAVPDYAIHPETSGAGLRGSNLAELAGTTSAMAFAGLAAVGTDRGDPLLGGGADGVGRSRRGRGAGAHARRRAGDRPVAVAVPALGRSRQPVRPSAARQPQRARRHRSAARAGVRGRRLLQHPRGADRDRRGVCAARAARLQDRRQRRDRARVRRACRWR